jgi:hypothetical protein
LADIMNNMSRKIISFIGAVSLLAILSGCGYDGHYRYPCQDPVNWENEECRPPICLATGTCTKDLLGFDPLATESATIEEDAFEETSEEVEEDEE